MELKIEYLPTGDLIPYARNSRTHTDEQVAQVAASIREFGFASPVLIGEDKTIIAGHCRVMAAQKLGLDTVPTVTATGWTEAQKRAYVIVDNRLAENAGWDAEMLKTEFADLDELGFDLSLLGFDDSEIDDLLADTDTTEPLTDPDEIPEPEETPVTRTGDIWTLGNHRLMCGDSTNGADVALLMDGERADIVLTDPPYGVNRDKGFGGERGFNGKGAKIKSRTYNDSWDAETPPKEAFDIMLAQAKSVIVFGGNFFTDKLPCSGFWLVWDKRNTMPTFGDCELAWTNLQRQSVKKYEFEYNGLIGREKIRYHPTQKPVGLFEIILADFSAEGQIVLDLFGGSGTTLIAAETTGRKCRMMELAPNYCDVILQRYINFKGSDADVFLLRDGKKIPYSEAKR